MGMQLLQFEQQVSAQKDHQLRDEPGFFRNIRISASRALAEKIMENASLYERIDPTEDELRENPLASVRHRWKIGVQTNLEEVEARAKEIDRARRGGLNEAADFLLSQTKHYLAAEGPCTHVLRHQLERMAADLRELAREE